jgi:hypothetical protein
VCEDRVNRSRRYFLMGALALPVARKIEIVAPAVPPVFWEALDLESEGVGLVARRGDQIIAVAYRANGAWNWQGYNSGLTTAGERWAWAR